MERNRVELPEEGLQAELNPQGRFELEGNWQGHEAFVATDSTQVSPVQPSRQEDG